MWATVVVRPRPGAALPRGKVGQLASFLSCSPGAGGGARSVRGGRESCRSAAAASVSGGPPARA
eukprot:8461045-Lingulodinium_polyedra.AAC.1